MARGSWGGSPLPPELKSSLEWLQTGSSGESSVPGWRAGTQEGPEVPPSQGLSPAPWQRGSSSMEKQLVGTKVGRRQPKVPKRLLWGT